MAFGQASNTSRSDAREVGGSRRVDKHSLSFISGLGTMINLLYYVYPIRANKSRLAQEMLISMSLTDAIFRWLYPAGHYCIVTSSGSNARWDGQNNAMVPGPWFRGSQYLMHTSYCFNPNRFVDHDRPPLCF